MKKRIAITGMIASLAILSAGSARAFHSQPPLSVLVASATTGGNLVANFTLTLADTVNTTTPKAKIDWVSPAPQPGGGWQLANTLMKLVWNVTDVGGGIQIYTDNTNGSANPKWIDPTPSDHTNGDSNPAGLVQVLPDGSPASQTLPVAWSIKADTQTVNGATPQLLAWDPNDNTLHGKPVDNPNSFQWLYMEDKGQTADIPTLGAKAFANADAFITMIKQSGIHGAQGPTNFFADADRVSYVYAQADFTTAAAQSTYTSNQVTVEAFIQ